METNDQKIQVLQRKLSIVEKERDILLALFTESDKVYYERLMDLESEIQVIQQNKLEFHNDFKNVYKFIREVQALRNRIYEREKAFNSAIKKVEELTFRISETDRVKSEFLSNTSHEIRTPLNAILGFLELIKSGLYDTPEEMMEYVNGAIESSNHLLKLLNEILDIARIDSGTLKINFDEVNLKMLVEALYTSSLNQAQQKEISLDLEFPEENIIVRGDSDRIKQIFNNLITNSLKFTPRGGKVTLRLSLQSEKNYVLCEVIDTGIGIEKENLRIIFDRFTQLDSGTTRKYQGAGLGLYITKNLIELMGGMIYVESQGLNKGSNFMFTLPLSTSDIEFNLNKTIGINKFKIEGNKNNPLVAIIIDDPITRDSLKEHLLNEGYATVTGITADDGFNIVKEHNPKLIILDWCLPRRKAFDLVNGITLFKILNSLPEYSSIPIIILTGHPIKFVNLFEDHIYVDEKNYFEKLVTYKKLMDRINSLLQKDLSENRIIIMLESDPKIYNLFKSKYSTPNYNFKILYNSEDFLLYLEKNYHQKAVLIMNQISAGVLDEDLYRFFLEKKPQHKYPTIIITNSPNYEPTDNLNYISNEKVYSILKKDFLEEPDRVYKIINKLLEEL